MNKEKVIRMIKYLEKRKMCWCFDTDGKLWTLETLSLFLLTA